MVETPTLATGGHGVVLILGPTASGKSGLALAMAQAFDGVVINADSMQVYRDLDLLSARPDASMLAAAPHQLYGFMDAAQACSAAHWASLAKTEVDRALAAGNLPIIVGGSGLYFKALLEGFSPIPDVAPIHRQRATSMLKKQGPEKFLAKLAERDPEIAARLKPGDSQRLIRAMEVWFATDKPLSWWQSLPPEPPLLDVPGLKIVLMPERKALYERCDKRFVEMVQGGAMDEVAALAERKLDPELPSMKALGVRQLMAALRGDLLLEQAVSDAQTQTRRYAKRQMTWLRHQIVADISDSAQDLQKMTANIFPKVSDFLLTTQRG